VTVVLRAARGTDAPALVDVFIAAWRAGYRDVVPAEVLGGLDVATVTGWLGPLTGDGATTTVVALVDGEPAGFARYGPDPERPGGEAGYLAALYVDPRAGGRGVGRRLLGHALGELQRSGRPDVRLWVFEANTRARQLYERAGFRPDGARTVDPRWRAAQISYRRPARNVAVPLAPLPDVRLAEIDVAVQRVHRPLRRPFRTALREVRELAGWRVTLTAADGSSATGTTVATPRITGDTDESIAAALAGPLRDAVVAGGPAAAVLDAVAAAGRGVPSAAAAVDMALHGLAAAALDRSLAELLGGSSAPSPPASAITVGVDSPAAMADAAAELAADGVGTVKLKLADAAADVARVLAVRDRLAGTTVALRVDANQAWTPEEAVRVLAALSAAGVRLELVEQPVAAADLVGLAFVTARSPYPVMADESVFTGDDVRRVADRQAADLVNVKLLKSGGLRGARDVVAACAETGLGLLVGCMIEPEEGVAAAAALAAAGSAGPLAHDLDAPWWVAGPGTALR
jgi:L-alanine-DL-glutamate epimerase-like enolase superfamily enzyme/ribosomal protein S18 acetylase RimI-like enzyme